MKIVAKTDGGFLVEMYESEIKQLESGTGYSVKTPRIGDQFKVHDMFAKAGKVINQDNEVARAAAMLEAVAANLRFMIPVVRTPEDKPNE